MRTTTVDVQEFMLVPIGFDRFTEALRAGVEVYHTLKEVLKDGGLVTARGRRGGLRPQSQEQSRGSRPAGAGHREGRLHLRESRSRLALDVAASELVEKKPKKGKVRYALAGEGRSGLSSSDLIALYREWLDAYPLVSIEDGLAEDDWEGWKELTAELGGRVQLVGDDLFVTNPEILAKGIAEGLANALLVKVNQIGTLTETLEAVEMAKTHAYANVMSHRSGETEDTTIADLAVATRCGQIKTGAPCRSDRVAKYNRLLRIEEELEGVATYPGAKAFPVGRRDPHRSARPERFLPPRPGRDRGPRLRAVGHCRPEELPRPGGGARPRAAAGEPHRGDPRPRASGCAAHRPPAARSRHAGAAGPGGSGNGPAGGRDHRAARAGDGVRPPRPLLPPAPVPSVPVPGRVRPPPAPPAVAPVSPPAFTGHPGPG